MQRAGKNTVINAALSNGANATTGRKVMPKLRATQAAIAFEKNAAHARQNTIDPHNVLRKCVDAGLYSLKKLGPHNSEHAYEEAMKFYLYDNSIPFITQLKYDLSVCKNRVHIGKVDIEVAKCVILELKINACRINASHKKQARRYLHAACQRYNTRDIICAVFLFDTKGGLQIWRENGHDLPVKADVPETENDL